MSCYRRSWYQRCIKLEGDVGVNVWRCYRVMRFNGRNRCMMLKFHARITAALLTDKSSNDVHLSAQLCWYRGATETVSSRRVECSFLRRLRPSGWRQNWQPMQCRKNAEFHVRQNEVYINCEWIGRANADAVSLVRYSASNSMSTNRVFVVVGRRRALTSRDMTDSRRYFTSPARRLSFNFDTELYRAAADLLTRRHCQRHDEPRSSISLVINVIVIVRSCVCLSVCLSFCPSVRPSILPFTVCLWAVSVDYFSLAGRWSRPMSQI